MTAESVELETARLVLRPRRAGDATVLRRLWTERDGRVPPHRRLDPEGRPSVEDLAEQIDAGSQPGLLTVVVRSSGEVIGYCGLVVPEGTSPAEPEIAYELLQSVHGQGYATEAADAAVEWARTLGHQRLRASVRDWNAASQRVLEKVGFTATGEVDPSQEYGDSLWFARDL